MCWKTLSDSSDAGRCMPTRGTTTTGSTCIATPCVRRSDLLETIIPFFREHPMRSPKQQNFEKFARCVELISTGRHKSTEGLIEIAEIVQTMNRKKPRHDLIRILRGHTPEVQDTGS